MLAEVEGSEDPTPDCLIDGYCIDRVEKTLSIACQSVLYITIEQLFVELHNSKIIKRMIQTFGESLFATTLYTESTFKLYHIIFAGR